MNNLTVFENEYFGKVRVIMIDNEPWFVGKDVAEALGYTNSKEALKKHVRDKNKQIIHKLDFNTLDIPNRGLTIINEPGLYSLIMRSKLKSAEDFQDWVYEDVLPSIRKQQCSYLSQNDIDILKKILWRLEDTCEVNKLLNKLM